MKRGWPIAIIMFFLIVGCGSYNNKSGDGGYLVDNPDLYENPLNVSVASAAISIPNPNPLLCRPFNNFAAPPRPCTLADVEHDVDPNDDYKPQIKVALALVDGTVYDLTGRMSQKGKSTRRAYQKSFRVKLDPGPGGEAPYNGEATLQLNKHPYDRTRMRNKLFFDFFVDVPGFNSLRTKFFDVTIDGKYYGLFTHIEKVDEHYLARRGMPIDGRIYKAQDFAFMNIPDMAVDGDGKPVNKAAFNSHLEIENGKNHKNVARMLAAINDAKNDKEFMKAFHTYFDWENYLTWMAINFVTGNRDTINQNFYLYNPKDSKRFFFIPWDYDGASRDIHKSPQWEWGYSLYWGIPLHRKFLSIAENRQALLQRVTEIHQIINSASVAARMAMYRPIVEPRIRKLPDSAHLTYDRWQREYNLLIPRIDQNVQLLFARIGYPMPFWQEVSFENGLVLKWEESIDLEGDPVVYDVRVADNPNFKHPIINQKGLDGSVLKIANQTVRWETGITLKPGRYFMEVTARERDNPAHIQKAFDVYEGPNDMIYFGVLEFVVR